MTIYISPTGNDTTGTGTIGNPYLTPAKAISVMSTGETIYCRGGTYNLYSQLNMSTKGTSGAYANMWAYPGEVPVFDFSLNTTTTEHGVNFNNTDYWHFKGIAVTGAPQRGVRLASGSDYNIFEDCESSYNGRLNNGGSNSGSGFSTLNGSYNEFTRCYAHHNTDQSGGGNTDGFNFPSNSGTGNICTECIAYRNADDGFDIFQCTGASVKFVRCYAIENGTLDGTYTDGGDGNGFKLGGNTTSTTIIATLEDCVASLNGLHGFTWNTSALAHKLYNCVGYKNGQDPITGGSAFNFQFGGASGSSTLTIKNSISYLGTGGVNLPTSSNITNNTWNAAITDPDFASETYGDSNFLHLNSTSPCRGAGIGPSADAAVPTVDIDGDTRSGATTDIGFDLYVFTPAATNYVRYVDPDATGTGSGLTWEDAYTSLAAFHAGETAHYDLVADQSTMTAYVRSSAGTADTTQCTIDGWITSAAYNLTINQVDSDPHNGKWDDTKYRLDCTMTGASQVSLYIRDNHVSVLGLQVGLNVAASYADIGAIVISSSLDSSSVTNVKKCLVRGICTGTANFAYGIWHADNSEANLLDNIISGFDSTTGYGIRITNAAATGLIYNNTIDNCNYGMFTAVAHGMITVNNIITNAGTLPISGTFPAGTDYNLTDAASIGYTVTGAGNIHDVLNATISYVNSTVFDYHLAATDTDAIGAGAGPSLDASVPTTDVDGDTRSGATTDIGADFRFVSGRGLTSAAISALGADEVEFYFLIKFGFSSPVYLTTAPRDIVYSGDTYLSSGLITGIPKTISESLAIRPATINLEMSGASLTNFAIPLTGNYRNVDVTIYHHIPSLNETTIWYQGSIDSWSTMENSREGKSTFSWRIANHWTNWDAVNGRLLTDEYQQSLFSGDLGLQYIGVTDSILNWWGKYTRTYKIIHQSGAVRYYTQAQYDALPAITRAMYPIGGGYSSGFSYQEGPPPASQMRYVGTFITTHSVPSNLISEYDFNSSSASASFLPIVYGEASVTGKILFRDITGTNSEYLWVVYALSEGECDSLTDVLFDGVSYLDASISGHVTVTFYSGSDTQTVGDASSGLDTASTEWTSNHRCRGIACAVVKYKYNTAIWQGEPTPQFILKGKKVYDPRTALTAWSENPSLVLRDYLTSTRYGKGLGTPSLANFNGEADGSEDYCDELVTENDGGAGTIKRFAFNGVIDVNHPIKKNVEAILFTMNAYLPWIAGKYKLVIERNDDTSVYSFTEDNMASSFAVAVGAINTLANIIYYDFIDPDIDYSDSTVYADSATYLTQDNNRVLRKTLKNKYENNRYRAQNRANTMLKLSRRQLTISLSALRADALQIETGQVIDVTRATQGFSANTFRVTDMTLGADGGISLSATDYEPTDLDWSVPTEVTKPTKSTLINPFAISAPTTLVMASGATHQITTAEGTRKNRIKISFTAPTADVDIDHYTVEYKESGDTDYTLMPPLIGRTNTTCYLDNVTTDVTYDFRIYAVNAFGTKSVALTGSHTVSGTPAVGLDQEVITTDGYSNSTFYWRTNWESLDTLDQTWIGYLSNTYGQSLKLQGNASTAVYARKTIKNAFNVVDYWDSDIRFKTKAIITNASVLTSIPATITVGYNVGSTAVAGFHFYWNSGSSVIEVYIYCWDNVGGGTSSLITTVADGALMELEFLYDESANTVTGICNGSSATIGPSGPVPDAADGTNGIVFAASIVTDPSSPYITMEIGEYAIFKA